jgi:signal transduction histidine kinase
MMADIAHELRTPLSVMKLEIEGLTDGLQPPERAAEALQTEIVALEQLIEDLRLLSLAEAGGLDLHLAETKLRPLLTEIVTTWQNQARSQQITLRLAVAEALPPVLADARRLGQVFHNLVSNALRYTPLGGTITLGGRVEGVEVWLWLADSGPGLPAEVLPHLFERFYRADPSRSRETGGSGLGLAIARQLVLLHGGRIWAESEQGAVFYVALPIS